VGNSQFPALAAVLENGRLEVEAAFFAGKALLLNKGVARALIGRMGVVAIDSLSN
jgi:hypothetical protein